MIGDLKLSTRRQLRILLKTSWSRKQWLSWGLQVRNIMNSGWNIAGFTWLFIRSPVNLTRSFQILLHFWCSLFTISWNREHVIMIWETRNREISGWFEQSWCSVTSTFTVNDYLHVRRHCFRLFKTDGSFNPKQTKPFGTDRIWWMSQRWQGRF